MSDRSGMEKRQMKLPEVRRLEDVGWKAFVIEEIFEIKSGKRLTKADMKTGNLPFIGAADSNNGITGFVANKNETRDSNVLGVNYNGSVAESFYHPYQCIFSDDVKRFSLKHMTGNKYIYLFIKVMITKQKNKYKYGYKFNERRMRRQKILLPATSSGEPDYQFMEDYMRQIEAKQLQKYFDSK